jgi:hypothetical protein
LHPDKAEIEMLKARKQPSPTIEPETANIKYFIEDLRNGKWLRAIPEEYVHSYKYGILSGGEETKWTNDPNEALAFDDKVEANKFYDRFYSSMPDFAVTEHEFISGRPSPTITEEGGMSPEKLAEHMQNIKFLMAYYGGKKTYIECMPGDKGAFNIPNTNKWLQEFNVKPGADWQVRSMKFAIQDWLRDCNIGLEFIQKFMTWLWAYKSTKDE